MSLLSSTLASDDDRPRIAGTTGSGLGSGPGEPGLVSVVVPSYNRGYIIERAIDSVLAQSYDRLEVIVVDDGSTDDTRRRVEAYGEPVRYLHRANGGVSAARNTGLEAARGEFIALLDSDDAWMPWKLAAQVRFLRAHPDVGMVWTDMAAIDPDGVVVYPTYLRRMYAAYGKTAIDTWLRPAGTVGDLANVAPDVLSERRTWAGNLFTAMFFGSLVHTSTVLLRRERLRAVGRFDETLWPAGEDYDFHWRTCREGLVGFLDVPSIRYRISALDQLTGAAYRVAIARNNLRTLERRIREDRARLELPRATIRRVLSEAHGWLGEELQRGNLAGSTRHLASGLRLRPRPRQAALLALSLFPFQAYLAAQEFKRHLRLPSRHGAVQDAR